MDTTTTATTTAHATDRRDRNEPSRDDIDAAIARGTAKRTVTAAKLDAATARAALPTLTIGALISELCRMFPERETIVRAVIVAVVAGQHVLMLGPPGSAKSLLVRILCDVFGKSYFEHLMTKFTVPEEVFGPFKLTALQVDRFTRNLTGRAADAEIVFLDEIFKANSAILNAFLTLLNERKVHDDGRAIDVPLMTCFGASNEGPEGPELEALYDRFLVRVETKYIAERANMRRMLTAAPLTAPGTFDIVTAQAAARAVVVSDDTMESYLDLWEACRAAGLKVSDRRWNQCLSIVQAAAHVDGRAVTEPEDLEILENVLWSNADERKAITRIIQTVVNPAGAVAVECLDTARKILAGLPTNKATAADRTALLSACGEASAALAVILTKVSALTEGRKVSAAKAEITTIRADVARLAMVAAGFGV